MLMICYENDMMIVISLQMTEKDVENIDEMVRNGLAMNRSDFVRQAIREKLSSDQKSI